MVVFRVVNVGVILGILLLSFRASDSWAKPRQLKKVLQRHQTTNSRALSSVVALGATYICNKIPGLAPRQRNLCQTHPGAIVAVGEGSKLGRAECQYQFRLRRWNCSEPMDNTATAADQQHTVATKEEAYIYAVRAAGVAYAITQACSIGNLTSCGCDRSKLVGNATPSGFKWGGCSADIKYGLTFARIFMDSKEIAENAKALMNLHNNRAGRKALKDNMGRQCKCHGVSGACTLKTCWTTLPSFRQIGNHLSRKFARAKKVVPIIGQRAQKPIFLKLERSKSLHRKPRRADLVYLESSPNYCEANPAIGSLGTAGRMCNRSRSALDSCESLCCGRGYNTHQYTRLSQCDCRFHWCCSVTCSQCSERIQEFTCK